MCAHREQPYAGEYELPISEASQDRHIVLPLFPGMERSDIDRVAEGLSVPLRVSANAMTVHPRLRIAIGLYSLELGGSQINTIDLASELRRRGHDVAIFVADYRILDTTILPVAEAASFVIHQLPRESTVKRQAHHVRKFVDDHQADVVHVFHEAEWLGPVGAVALAGRGQIELWWSRTG